MTDIVGHDSVPEREKMQLGMCSQKLSFPHSQHFDFSTKKFFLGPNFLTNFIEVWNDIFLYEGSFANK